MLQKRAPHSTSATKHDRTWLCQKLRFLFLIFSPGSTWPYILTFPTLIFENFESTVLCVVSVSETTKNSGILCTHGNLKGLVRFVSKCQVTKPECWRKYSSEWYEMKMVALPYCHREVLKKPWCYFPWFSVASLARRYSHKLFNPLEYSHISQIVIGLPKHPTSLISVQPASYRWEIRIKSSSPGLWW